MTRDEEIKKQLAALKKYLASLVFVHSYGGCILSPQSRPTHGKKVVKK